MATIPSRTVKLRRLGRIVAQVTCGIGIVLGIGLGIRCFLNARAVLTVPAGWRIIRPPAQVATLAIVGDMVWAGGKDGVSLLDRRTGTQLPLPPGAPSFSFVHAMLQDAQGTLWIAHDDGLTSFAQGRWTTLARSGNASLKPALSLLETRDLSLWVGTTGGMACYAHGDWLPVVPPPSMPITAANVLYQDQSDAVWVGCSDAFHGGLYRFEKGQWRVFGRADGLPHMSVNMLLQDRSGTLWAATGQANQGGLARWQQGRWVAADLPTTLASKKMRSVFMDHAGRLWFGSEYDGIAVQAAGGWQVYSARNGLAGSEVLALVQDADGIYWLGTNNGLSRIERFASLN